MIPCLMNCISTITAKAVSTTMVRMTSGEYITMIRRAPEDGVDVTVPEDEEYENESEHEFD